MSKVQNIARHLIDVGENMSDITIMAKILASLSTKFSNFQTSWDCVDPNRQTISYLQERLMQEEARLLQDTSASTALVVYSKKNRKNGGNGNRAQHFNNPSKNAHLQKKGGKSPRSKSQKKGQC